MKTVPFLRRSLHKLRAPIATDFLSRIILSIMINLTPLFILHKRGDRAFFWGGKPILLKRKKRDIKGQSSVEFIISFVVVLGFCFSFFRLAILYTNGYLVHYATYMAARSYMVFDNNSNEPSGGDGGAGLLAKKVFDGFKVGGLVGSYSGNLEVHDPESFNTYINNLYVGVWTEFQQQLPTVLMGKKRTLNLRSESFLGREPTRSECYNRICRAMGEAALTSEYCGVHSTLFDNGC